MSNPQEFKRVEWLKVALGGKVKRIYNPSKDIKCLSNQIKSHFKELNGYQLTQNDHLGEQEFQIQWVPSGNLPITITDNDQLEEIFIMHGLSDENKIPRFEVNAGLIWFSLTESVKNSDVKSSSLTEDDASNFSGKNQPYAENPYLQYLGSINESVENPESEETKSEMLEDSSDNSDSSSDDEGGHLDDELQLFYHLKHSVRMEIEKQVLHQLSQFKDLQHSNQVEELQEPVKVEEPLNQSVDIRVSIMSQNEKASDGVLSNPIFSKIKTFFSKKAHQPINPLHQALIQSQKELYLKVTPNTYCSLKWSIKNDTSKEWAKGLQLVNVFASPSIQIGAQPINAQLRPHETSEIEIVIYIPEDFRDSAQLVMFRIVDLEGDLVGEPMTAFIQIDHESQFGVAQKYTDEQLLGFASQLVDEGYGSFDRAYTVVRCLRGDLQKTRESLSQIIFQECQM